MYQVYKKIQAAIVWVFMGIVYLTEIFIPLILCAQVILRKFFNSPIFGAEELAGFAFTAMVLFGSAVLCYRKKYIVVDFFVKRAKGRLRDILAAVADLATLATYGGLIYCFWIAIPKQAKFKSGIFQVPKSVYSIVMIVVFSFMAICTIEYVVQDLRAAAKNEEVEEKGTYV